MLTDTLEELINNIKDTYKNPLMWNFQAVPAKNIKYMYQKDDELTETFFVFYKKLGRDLVRKADTANEVIDEIERHFAIKRNK